jgi:hypothetical protein
VSYVESSQASRFFRKVVHLLYCLKLNSKLNNKKNRTVTCVFSESQLCEEVLGECYFFFLASRTAFRACFVARRFFVFFDLDVLSRALILLGMRTVYSKTSFFGILWTQFELHLIYNIPIQKHVRKPTMVYRSKNCRTRTS